MEEVSRTNQVKSHSVKKMFVTENQSIWRWVGISCKPICGDVLHYTGVNLGQLGKREKKKLPAFRNMEL